MNSFLDINNINVIDKAIIIGNGFDLNLGLETSYAHFLKNKLFIDLSNNGNSLCQWLSSDINSNWIDVENDLKRNYNRLTNSGKNANHVISMKKDFLELSNALCQYIQLIDLNLEKRLNLNSFYFKEFKEKYKSFENCLIINFNYTQTINYLCAINQTISNRKAKIEMLHGEAKSNNIVFGIDESLKLLKSFDFLYKTSNPYYNCGNILRELISMKEIVFMGHSFGETDHYFFKHVFEKSCKEYDYDKNYTFTIYHYGLDDRRRIISEIRHMIGENNSMIDFYSNNNVNYIDVTK